MDLKCEARLLRWRLLLGIVFGGALIALAWADARAAWPGAYLLPVALAVAVLGAAEVLRLAAGGGRPTAWPVLAGAAAIVVAGWVGGIDRGLAWSVVACGLALAAVFCDEMVRYVRPGGVNARIAAAALALAYVGLPLAMIVDLRLRWGVAGLLWFIVAVKAGDIGAYTVGRLLGRHSMSRYLSPKKTWEGAAGAVLFSSLGSWAYATGVGGGAGPAPTALAAIGFGVAMAVAGMLGDLAESLLKRDAGIKDSGPWMPGFGGVLDLVDSLLFAAPLAWAWALLAQR